MIHFFTKCVTAKQGIGDLRDGVTAIEFMGHPECLSKLIKPVSSVFF